MPATEKKSNPSNLQVSWISKYPDYGLMTKWCLGGGTKLGMFGFNTTFPKGDCHFEIELYKRTYVDVFRI